MRLIDADKYIEEESEGTFLGDISIEKFNEITPTVEAYTKDEVIAMLTEIKDEIASNYLIDATTGVIISGIIPNFKAQELLDNINNKIDKLRENKE